MGPRRLLTKPRLSAVALLLGMPSRLRSASFASSTVIASMTAHKERIRDAEESRTKVILWSADC
jgi:hypothetical protein